MTLQSTDFKRKKQSTSCTYFEERSNGESEKVKSEKAMIEKNCDAEKARERKRQTLRKTQHPVCHTFEGLYWKHLKRFLSSGSV